jgi:hypothetical protein
MGQNIVEQNVKYVCYKKGSSEVGRLGFLRNLLRKIKHSFDSGRKVEFKAFHKLHFDSRAQPAKLSKQSKENLLSKDYAPIGTIKVKHITKIMWRKVGVKDKTYSHKMDPTSDLLNEAAEKGGDIVTLSADTQSSSETVTMKGNPTKFVERQIYERRNEQDRYGNLHIKDVWRTVEVPVAWETMFGEEKSIFSEGIVWRKDPGLARKTNLQELQKSTGIPSKKVPKPAGPIIKYNDNLVNTNDSFEGYILSRRSLAATDNHGNTLWHAAAKKGATRFICGFHKFIMHTRALESKWAVNFQVDINARNKDGDTALHHAAAFGKVDSLNALIRAGADINATRKDGNTALHLAAYRGYDKTAAALIAAGANINTKNKDDNTARDIAARLGDAKFLEVFKAAGNKEKQL